MRGVRGSAFGDGPSFHVVREALARYIDANGLRAVARQVGVVPTGLAGVVSRHTRPRRPTLRRLRRWYVQARLADRRLWIVVR